jgi:hypothetical protein
MIHILTFSLLLAPLFMIQPPDLVLRVDSDQWERYSFGESYGTTRYTLMRRDGRTVMNAKSSASASGLIRRVTFDPATTPIIEWSWTVAGVLPKGDERTRAGDDYAARIYVTFEVDPDAPFTERMTHRTLSALFDEVPFRAINYIWANKIAQGTHVKNPYSSSVCMIAVQSGNASAGVWKEERRNLVQDYRMCFGSAPTRVNGVAIMTDSDNTKGTAEAWYGDIQIRQNR